METIRPKYDECKECWGTGSIQIDCPCCGCPDGDYKTCEECDGTGIVEVWDE